MAIDDRYITSINGKPYLRYGGALARAQEMGLRELYVDLIQIPSAENGYTAICKAFATLGRDENEKCFQEIGDANPSNCGKMVVNALIRMAATRAKGRALRDAIGHGEALAEEIGEAEPSAISPAWSRDKEESPVIRDQFCSECGVELLPAVVTYSKKNFGKSLCRDCQPKGRSGIG